MEELIAIIISLIAGGATGFVYRDAVAFTTPLLWQTSRLVGMIVTRTLFIREGLSQEDQVQESKLHAFKCSFSSLKLSLLSI